MKEIFYATTSSFKFRVAKRHIVKRSDFIKLRQLDEETSEIQSTSVEDVAVASAKEVFEQYEKPVFVSDAGGYVSGLNGFPGPFLKYINEWLDQDDMRRLFDGLRDRLFAVSDCLALSDKDGNIHTFTSVVEGRLADEPRGNKGIPIDTFFIPEGMSSTLAELPNDDREDFWFHSHTHWEEMLDFIAKNEDRF